VRALLGAGDGAIVVGADGRIVLWNAAAERLLGHQADDVVGRPCCQILGGRSPSGETVCSMDCSLRSRASSGHPVDSVDVTTRTKAGTPIRINLSTLAVAAAGYDEALTVHLFRDVAAGPEAMPAPALAEEVETAERVASLTRREREILKILTTGANTRVAAQRLGVSQSTIRNHVQNLFGKLGVHSRLEAVAFVNTHRVM
jgi:PAS domain S-box-containing protein